MNTDPREFDLQERALREDPAWRDIARALHASPGEPPADFAVSVAAMAAATRAPAPAAVVRGREGRIERWLLRALSLVLGAIGIGVVATYGNDWFGGVIDGFDAIGPALGGSSALNWALAAGACIALSWAFARGKPALR